MNILTKSILTTLAVLLGTAASSTAETFQVLRDTYGNTATSKIAKASGKSTTLPIGAKSAAYIHFDVSSGGYTASQVTAARLVVFFPKVTKAGNVNLSINTSGFQETFSTSSIPTPATGAAFASIPVTTALSKNFYIVDVTAQVRAWLSGTAEFGFALTSDGIAACTVGSKEGSASGYPAILEVDVNQGGGTVSGTDGNFSGLVSGGNGSFLDTVSAGIFTTNGVEGSFFMGTGLGGNPNTTLMGGFTGYNSKGPQIRFQESGESAFIDIGTDGSNNFVVENGLDQRMFTINQSGSVAIGSTTPVDSILDVEGNMHLNTFDIFLREGSDRNHGLGWYGAGKSFAGESPDGPILYGNAGGALGTNLLGQKLALTWNAQNQVGIGTSSPLDSILDVEGTLRMNQFDIYLREDGDRNHGLGWYGSTKPFAGLNVDGPVLYGSSGGALGSNIFGTQKVALSWDSNAKVTIPGLISQGSGAGTTEAPNRSLITRRLNTTSLTNGQIVAIDSNTQLQRDGTNAGFILVCTTAGNQREFVAMGVSATGASVNKVGSVSCNTVGNTTQVYADADNVVMFTLTFGDPFNNSNQTIVTLQRRSNDFYWVGTVTSTVNQ